MLPLPTDGEATSCVVGIDPGTVKLGLSCITYRVDTFEITQVETITLDGSRLPHNEWLSRMYGDRAGRVKALGKWLHGYLVEKDPFGIACESPFYNQKRPNAYGALKEVICALRDNVWEYNIRKPMYLIDPPTVKRAVGASGNADKDAVKKAILGHPVLGDHIRKLAEMPDEHSLDALAVAFCLLRDYMSGKVRQEADPS